MKREIQKNKHRLSMRSLLTLLLELLSIDLPIRSILLLTCSKLTKTNYISIFLKIKDDYKCNVCDRCQPKVASIDEYLKNNFE